MGFRAQGLGFRVQGFGFRALGLGFRAVSGFGFRVSGLGFRVFAGFWGLELWGFTILGAWGHTRDAEDQTAQDTLDGVWAISGAIQRQ